MNLGNTQYFRSRADSLAGPAQQIVATGDLNGDGLTDLVLRGEPFTPGLGSLRIALGQAAGGFADAQMFAGAVPQVMDAHVLVGDFTGDGKADLAVYDAGVYDWSARLTLGRVPVLYVGGADGKLSASTAFADAIAPLVQPGSRQGGRQTDLTMGVKDVDAADIDRDGDLDLWVESTGSANIGGHFMINEGGGKFRIDQDQKIGRATYHGPGAGDYWRYGHSAFIDLNRDGAQDLVMLQIRDNDPTHLTQSSFVYMNDGRGNFPAANIVRLPLPDFYYGYTSAQAADAWDVNGDGRQDLVLVHTRNDDVSGPLLEPAWTGNYIQVLVQGADGQYTDQTQARMGNQAAWTANTLPAHQYAIRLTHADVNQDGIVDMLLGYNYARPSASAPVLFLGQSDGTFKVADAALLSGGDAYFGEGVWALNLNGDAFTDFVHLDEQPGVNGRYEDGGDDYMTVVTQLGHSALGGTGSQARTLQGTSGNDTLQGGAGIDTAVFSGARGAYTITRTASGYTVVSSVEGTDALANVERLRFSDAKVALDVEGNAGMAYRLYQAAFNRTPDQGGLGYQMNALDQGLNIAQVAANFIASPEFSQTYGSLDDTRFVTQLYQNVLHRAPDAAGLAYHVGNLASGANVRANVLVGFSESPENQAALIGVIQNGMTYTG